jgi:hypothetical protein
VDASRALTSMFGNTLPVGSKMVPAITPVSNWPTAGAADTSSITSNVSSAPTVRDPDPSKRMHLALTCIDIELEIIFLPPEQTLSQVFLLLLTFRFRPLLFIPTGHSGF